MRSNINIFEPLCVKFPALKEIDSFTSGITATMMHVITHLNPKEKQPLLLDDATHQSIRENVLEQAKQVIFLLIIFNSGHKFGH